MIKRELTNTYLSSFDLLTEALYLCWTNSFCEATEQLIQEKLREQIRSYGLYDHKHAIRREIPINFINNFEFKTLVWVNKFSNAVSQNELCEYVELYKQVIDEIENNLFVLKSKTAQIAYANILLRNLDKSHIHKRKLDIADYIISELCSNKPVTEIQSFFSPTLQSMIERNKALLILVNGLQLDEV